jgi:hypothetical protein
MRLLLFAWWRFCPPVNIRVYFRALFNQTGIGRFDQLMLEECFHRCSPLERLFILRRLPPIIRDVMEKLI